MADLSDFITSRVRAKILTAFFTNPNEPFYVREMTREIGEEINSVRRELARLAEKGILKTENRANRIYYSLNKAYPFYQELQQMVLKENGLGKKIRRLRNKLGELDFVMFSSQFFNRQVNNAKDLDILIIGEVVLPELEILIKEEEKQIGREINYTVLDKNEFKFRKQRRDSFLMDVMYGKKILVVGDEEEFVDRSIDFNKAG